MSLRQFKAEREELVSVIKETEETKQKIIESLRFLGANLKKLKIQENRWSVLFFLSNQLFPSSNYPQIQMIDHEFCINQNQQNEIRQKGIETGV